jgi:seryl-tRNA synthetase
MPEPVGLPMATPSTKQTRHRFDEYQGKLAEIDSVSAALENSLWTQSILQSSQKSQQIININPANVHPSLLTAVDQLQKNIDQLAIQLKQQNSPTILDKKNILSKLKKINGQIKPLDAKLQNTETKLNQIAGQLLNTLLENYKSRLEALNNEIQWGQINSGHAYASFIKSKSDKLNRQHQKAVNNYLSRFHNEAP